MTFDQALKALGLEHGAGHEGVRAAYVEALKRTLTFDDRSVHDRLKEAYALLQDPNEWALATKRLEAQKTQIGTPIPQLAPAHSQANRKPPGPAPMARTPEVSGLLRMPTRRAPSHTTESPRDAFGGDASDLYGPPAGAAPIALKIPQAPAPAKATPPNAALQSLLDTLPPNLAVADVQRAFSGNGVDAVGSLIQKLSDSGALETAGKVAEVALRQMSERPLSRPLMAARHIPKTALQLYEGGKIDEGARLMAAFRKWRAQSPGQSLDEATEQRFQMAEQLMAARPLVDEALWEEMAQAIRRDDDHIVRRTLRELGEDDPITARQLKATLKGAAPDLALRFGAYLYTSRGSAAEREADMRANPKEDRAGFDIGALRARLRSVPAQVWQIAGVFVLGLLALWVSTSGPNEALESALNAQRHAVCDAAGSSPTCTFASSLAFALADGECDQATMAAKELSQQMKRSVRMGIDPDILGPTIQAMEATLMIECGVDAVPKE